MTPIVPIHFPAVLIGERKGELRAVLVAYGNDLVFHPGAQIQLVAGGCSGGEAAVAASRQVPLWPYLPLHGGQAPVHGAGESAPD